MDTKYLLELGYQSTVIICFGLLFTSLILFNVSNCKHGVRKDKSCGVAMVLVEVALGMLALYFMNDYLLLACIIAFIIVFPLVTNATSSGATCPRTQIYAVPFPGMTYEWTNSAFLYSINGTTPFTIPNENIFVPQPGQTITYNASDTNLVMIINCSNDINATIDGEEEVLIKNALKISNTTETITWGNYII